MSSPTRHSNQLLIIVNVHPNSVPLYTYLAAADASTAENAIVLPGDQIGWYVRVSAASGWYNVPYTLAFDDSSILGTGLISVPTGGASGFFTVQSLSGSTKYTLSVSGVLPPSDPQIQVDPNGVFSILAQLVTGTQYSVRWTQATNAMDYLNPATGLWTTFPPSGLSIKVGDGVQFFAVLTSPLDFEIIFPSDSNNNLWASPFSLLDNEFEAINQGANETTGLLPVADGKDPAGNGFQFRAQLTDKTSPSAAYKFVLSI